jgi:hypothetical protein
MLTAAPAAMVCAINASSPIHSARVDTLSRRGASATDARLMNAQADCASPLPQWHAKLGIRCHMLLLSHCSAQQSTTWVWRHTRQHISHAGVHCTILAAYKGLCSTSRGIPAFASNVEYNGASCWAALAIPSIRRALRRREGSCSVLFASCSLVYWPTFL